MRVRAEVTDFLHPRARQVLLFLLLMLLTMAIWHWQRCGEGRASGAVSTEGLLDAADAAAAADAHATLHSHHLAAHPRTTRGRTSIDSSLSCVVCMDVAINCVLMPCAHEIACLRCASRLGMCPICRRPVDSTLKVVPAEVPSAERALLSPVADADEGSRGASADEPAGEASPRPPAPSTDEEAAGPAAAPAAGGAEEAPEKPPKPALPAMLCLRCAAAPPNCLFLPCSHKVWCNDCAAQLPPTCPICNTGITQSLRTFHKRL